MPSKANWQRQQNAINRAPRIDVSRLSEAERHGWIRIETRALWMSSAMTAFAILFIIWIVIHEESLGYVVGALGFGTLAMASAMRANWRLKCFEARKIVDPPVRLK
jgi:predicted O-methyltransferase YrrM